MAPTLTAEDYVEIRRVALYYNLGWDNAASVDNGYIVSRSFAPDAVFRREGGPTWNGNEAVARAATENRGGVHHWDTNLVIEPHPDGAEVFRYTLIVSVDDTGTPARITHAGPLYEIFTKTADGWLIKDRYHYGAGNWTTDQLATFRGSPNRVEVCANIWRGTQRTDEYTGEGTTDGVRLR